MVLVAGSTQAAKPQRIVSLNLCTDQLLLLLVDPSRIASISFLSAVPEYSQWVEQTEGLHLNHALAEEIVPLKPDLILAGDYTDSYIVRFFEAQNIPVQRVSLPSGVNSLFTGLQTVASLTGDEASANTIVKEQSARMQSLQDRAIALFDTDGERPVLASIGPNAFTQGVGTIRDELIGLAQMQNLAATLGMKGNAHYSLEQLIYYQPDILMLEDSTPNKDSLAQILMQHPAMRRGLKSSVRHELNTSLMSCAGPSLVDALERLVDIHESFRRQGGALL